MNEQDMSHEEKMAVLKKGIQQLTGFDNREMAVFMAQPRTGKILSRMEAASRVSVLFEVSESKGCVAGHKPGDTYLFPKGGALDLAESTGHLCPFLMPPMTRIMWLVQERVWEGLDPLPLYAVGHCDDVGLDCDGWGRVVIKARILNAETQP